MLGKLFKSEWKDTYLVGTISSIVVLILALIGAVIFQTDLWKMDFESETAAAIMETTISFYFITYMLSIMALAIVMRYYFFYRYYKNLFTDHGYLMNTLPVTGSQLIKAKLLVALIWQYITWIVVYFAIFILIFSVLSGIGDLSFAEFINEFKEIPVELYREIGEGVPFLFSMMAIILLSPLTEILIMYAAVGIGQLCKKHKFLISVLILVGLYVLRAFLMNLAMIPLNFILIGVDSVWGFNVGGIIALLAVIAVIIGLWYANRFFLEKKLNLE